MLTVEAFRQSLDAKNLETVDYLREIIAGISDDLEENIKWNAPNYAIAGRDRITLGLERKGGVRVVFHLGAKVADNSGFKFDDIDQLARWPAPDRGVVVFADKAAVEARRNALASLCTRWLAQTS